METRQRTVCKDEEFIDRDGKTFNIKKGEVYTTSLIGQSASFGPPPKEGHVVLFSTYWLSIPITYFEERHDT